jgi:membrane protease YdiL (CAAX protease family)
VSKRQPDGGRRGTQPNRGKLRFALDPYFACLVFAGVAVGTLSLHVTLRLSILWATLLVLWLAYCEGKAFSGSYRYADMGRGVLIGLVIGLPTMVLTFRGLARAIPILYVGPALSPDVELTGSTVFATLVVLAPLAEELFFRDMLQKERGFWIATGLYAAVGVLLFLPTAGQFPAVLFAVSGAAAVLGVVYAFLYERYGLATALSCHVTANLMLLCLPATLSHLDLFSR